MKRINSCPALLVALFFSLIGLWGCKQKKDETTPFPTASTPSFQQNLAGNGSVKYWQPVQIIQQTRYSSVNLYLTSQACAVDNYIVFFQNGDYEERAVGAKCYADERLIANTYKWRIEGRSLWVGNFYGGGIYEISSTLFSSEVTITELDATRFKGYRLRGPGDTIRFTLSAVPM